MTDVPKLNLNINVDGNKIYDDACSPVARPAAQTLGLIPRAIKAAFSPVEKWILQREYSVKETQVLLEKKLQNVDPEKIVTPEAYVAVPAMQAISYSMDNEEIRDMYASLLAKAVNSDFKDDVHPAFIEIIKQLSPADAQFFKYLSKTAPVPICKVRHQMRIISPDVSSRLGINDEDADNFADLEYLGKDLASNFLNIHIDGLSDEQINLSLSNLIRLGIAATNYGSAMEQSEYLPFVEFPEIKTLFDQYPNDNKNKTVIVMGTCGLTTLGKQFASICLDN